MIALDRPIPKSCGDCPCNDHDAWCAVTLSDFADDFCKTRLPDCPLIDLSKYEDDGK